MAFQRSYSKVWWGSDNQLPAAAAAGSSFTSGGYYYSSYSGQQQQQQQQRQYAQQQQFAGAASGGFHSLDFNNFKSYPGNLSRIQEVDDEQNASKLSWEKRDSPGSLRSQDSGFSDNDEAHSTRSMGGHSTKEAAPSAKSQSSAHAAEDSPTSARSSIATPPTVIRRVGKSEFYSPLVSVSRRISFHGSPASEAAGKVAQENDLLVQLDNMQLLSATPQQQAEGELPQPQKRRRRIGRKATKPLTPTRRRTLPPDNADSLSEGASGSDEESMHTRLTAGASPVPPYNNETVYLGAAPTVTVTPDDTLTLSPHCYTANTSTPKAPPRRRHAKPLVYENPLLNGHPPALQCWLGELRQTYEHEVMSTLQAKSIVQEAFKNLTITTNTVAKLIRQLQQRGMHMQSDFERVERLLTGAQAATLHEALSGAEQLLQNVAEFTCVLERRGVFFTESRADRRRYDENIAQLRSITKDTRYSLAQQQYISLESLLDDLQVLRRYLLFAVRLVFEKMVRVIVQSIEQGQCDLMLRANINMIATLMNIDYDGFASLTDAFVQNEAVRTLLIICLEHRLSSVRALALRALATVCCAPEAIMQLGACGGVEILRDILQLEATAPLDVSSPMKTGETERREAVSLLTQITAAWHGPKHRVDGLKDCIEALVAGVTQLVVQTSCAQTLLLCAAALNNLSRIEITSHYSIMSNEAIFRLIEAVEHTQEGSSIFFYEQVVAMLHNMSLNKKCHSHLANGSIIGFITSAYQTEFYKGYDSRAEREAQRRVVKAILHTVTRLVHDSSLGVELLEQQRIPAFLRLAASGAGGSNSDHAQLLHDRDVSALARQLLAAQQQPPQQQQASAQQQQAAGLSEADATCGMKFNLTRQESFV